MANGMNQNPGIGFDVEAGRAGLEQVRSFAASQEAQQVRDRAMSNPTSEALYAGIKGAFTSVDVSLGADAAAAQAELLGIARSAGASDAFVGQLQQAMANPEMLRDTDFVGQLTQQMGTLDMDAAARSHGSANWSAQMPQGPTAPEDYVGSLYTHDAGNWTVPSSELPGNTGNVARVIDEVIPDDVVPISARDRIDANAAAMHDAVSADAAARHDALNVGETLAHGAVDIGEAAIGYARELVAGPETAADRDIGVTHVGPESAPENPISPDSLPRVPDASASREELAEFDRQAKAYAEQQSMDLDNVIDSSDPENKIDNYSSLAKYLVDTKDAAPLNKDNVTAEDYNIISNLAYARKFSNSVEYRIAAGREDLSVQEYCDALLAADARSGGTMKAKDRAFLIALRNNERYANLHIDHVDATDTGVVNTSIVTLSAGDGHAFVGIQGTNGTVTDWINDMEFTRSELTAEEKWINERVKAYLGEYDSFDTTGHSQGGRNAITLAAFLPPEYADKLRKVYSLDGPGYPKDFLAKYGDRFKDIEGKIYQIFPNDSFVGQLMERVGLVDNCYYVGTKNEGDMWFDPMTHGNERWAMWDSEDNAGYEYVEQTFLSKVIREASTFLVNDMPPEVLHETLPTVIRLFSDPKDPTQLDFNLENLKANLSNISFGDGAELASVVLVAVADGVLELADKVEPYLKVAEAVLTIASLFPWPGAPFCAAAAKFIGNAKAILETVVKVCEVISDILTLYLEWKAEKKRKEREAYLAENQRIVMNYKALQEASKYMDLASISLELAGIQCDYMWNCFLTEEAEKSEEADEDGVLQTIWRVVTEIVSPAKALQRAVKALKRLVAGAIDFGYLKRNPYCDKGMDAIARVEAAAKSIMTDCGYYPDTNEFEVNPSVLGKYGLAGESAAVSMLAAMEKAQGSVQRLGSSWEADDYTQMRTQVDQAMDNVREALEAVKNDYVAVQQIAQGYSVLQQTAVQEFQAAAN